MHVVIEQLQFASRIEVREVIPPASNDRSDSTHDNFHIKLVLPSTSPLANLLANFRHGFGRGPSPWKGLSFWVVLKFGEMKSKEIKASLVT